MSDEDNFEDCESSDDGGDEVVAPATLPEATVVDVDDMLDDELDELDAADALDGNLRNLVDNTSLRWIFVGGKGGVGKTTTSCSIGAMLSKHRESVLIVSTDPAHNLSDAFSQKFCGEPTQVAGFDNLFCMEIDPKANNEKMTEALTQVSAQASAAAAAEGGDGAASDAMGGLGSIMGDLSGSIPGIDEAMSFAELMKSVDSFTYSVVIFDTAPTGHTLRLLSFPKTLEKTMGKFLALKDRFAPMLQSVSAMMGGGAGGGDVIGEMSAKLESTLEVIKRVNSQFKDPSRTTFVCVCIPEFLSLYETERLVQALAKFEIDTHNIIVNQVLIPPSSWAPEAGRWADMKCNSRQQMQFKYLEQIYDLYQDFHVVTMPLLDIEVRGTPLLKRFAHMLLNEYDPDDDETAYADM
tara:strand:- start:56 stop:1282 length:1227 start_codon:yes stop_codon:yes gene_type:complete